MTTYKQELGTHDWTEEKDCSWEVKKICLPSNGMNFIAEMLVCQNTNIAVNKILLYSHTTGKFEKKEDAECYLDIFCTTIKYLSKNFPSQIPYYIQNYEWFDPTWQIEYIKNRASQGSVKESLGTIPFERQMRVCENPPEIIKIKMPGIEFCGSIWEALKRLWIYK